MKKLGSCLILFILFSLDVICSSLFFVILRRFFFLAVFMNNRDFIISIKNGVARDSAVRFTQPLNLKIFKSENVAIVGNNGSGKTLLVNMLTGRYPLCKGTIEYDFSPSADNAVYKNVRMVSFRDIYGSAEADYCYQLRWNVHEQDDVPTVADIIDSDNIRLLHSNVYRILNIEQMLYKKVVMLSSGELRKLHIAMALADNPRLLIVDNPFIGLDAVSRNALEEQFASLAVGNELQIILLLSCYNEIPGFVHRVVTVDNKCIMGEYLREEYLELQSSRNEETFCSAEEIVALQNKIASLPCEESHSFGNEVLSFNNVTIAYGQRIILKNISWRVNTGEVWVLGGANGSGKSTLLALVCADNLQSYACDISLFGRKRGTGESIWDIKKRIGYVSPEIHRSYLRNLPVGDIVASGLFDSVGLYRKVTEEQHAQCRFWLELFGISHIADSSFLRVSSSEQRLALLARAFVKNPDLLLLDEPFHGLDMYNKEKAKAVVEAYSRIKGKTVIFVSHYKEELPCTATNCMLLCDGETTMVSYS